MHGLGECSVTTERMEAYSIEVGDQIYVNYTIYRVFDVGISDDGYIFNLIDEEGNRATLCAEDTKKIPVVIDILAEV